MRGGGKAAGLAVFLVVPGWPALALDPDPVRRMGQVSEIVVCEGHASSPLVGVHGVPAASPGTGDVCARFVANAVLPPRVGQPTEEVAVDPQRAIGPPAALLERPPAIVSPVVVVPPPVFVPPPVPMSSGGMGGVGLIPRVR